jgi:TetR/AcrR family transcriptional regulator
MAKGTTKMKTHEEILKLSIPLFAETGYDGVSMRDVAVAVGLTPAALYYHFSNKEQLYVDTVAYAFREVTDVLKAAIEAAPTPLEQLESIISVSIKMLANNKPLVRLIQWVKLDSDRQHPKKLATAALNELFSTVQKLVGKLGSGYNASRLLISIASMVVFPFEIEDTCQYLSGYQSRNTDPAVLTKHVVQLLRQSLSGMEADSQ